MNKVYIEVGVIAVVAVVYCLELLRRKRARALNRQELCARCQADLKLQPATAVQRYRTLQPQFLYCAACAAVLKGRERAFFLSFGVVAVALLVSAFYFVRA